MQAIRTPSRTVVAVGGNSLISAGAVNGNLDTHGLAREVCEELATIAQYRGGVVITHGNGPQVGFELLRNSMASSIVPPDGMDVNVAATQGYIGYFLQQVLGDVLEERGVDIPVTALITQVLVAPDDPAFRNPSKPVGPFYSLEDAGKAMDQHGWIMKEDAGRGWRRVVPSPKPRRILELEAIRTLVNAGQIVICVGGGGVPVVREGYKVRGVPAVIDKDHVSALLATRLEADTYVISTAVPHVYVNFGKPDRRAIEYATLEEMEHFVSMGEFAEGSMLPKIRASIGFLKHGGERVVITSPGNILRAMDGKAGTTIVHGTAAIKSGARLSEPD
ncbi:MAG: carbamate kinase [Candidatus Fermentibacteraceae bacterium]|nr:carbamate kinase [Candidatus Fermentibacteraceae bacterium]